MLHVLGSPRRMCDGLSRREMLTVGAVGSLSMTDLWRAQRAEGETGDAGPAATFGRAKRIILLYLYGAAAQHELFDPKPNAPLEIRGEFKPASTSVPGVQIGEHLPRLAEVADRATIIRSMTHPYNIHSAAYSLTGVPHVDVPMELDPYDSRHWPFFGSVLDYLAQQKLNRADPHAPPPKMPRNVALPFRFSSKSPEFTRGGPYGGFLGNAYNPVWTEFETPGRRVISRWRGNEDRDVRDPFAGVSPDDRLTLSRDARLRRDVTIDRLEKRRSLLTQLEDARPELERSPASAGLDRYSQMAYTLITSRKLRDALDVSQEPIRRRERYGMTLFGQSTLAGLRLLEAGAPLVTVVWDEYSAANSGWDTHFNHYERLKDELLPGLDAALSSLLLDLEDRGMLDDTLVMCLTEHGRTPKLSQTARGAGREHWSNAYSVLLAGGGTAGGKVVGASDRDGAFVHSDPVSPKDVLATMYHLAGVDPHTTVPDRAGRPYPLVSGGEIRTDLLM